MLFKSFHSNLNFYLSVLILESIWITCAGCCVTTRTNKQSTELEESNEFQC